MIKAEITTEANKTHIITELNGDLATIMSEIQGFLNIVLKNMQKFGKQKEHLLTLLYQMTLKEWSEEDENN